VVTRSRRLANWREPHVVWAASASRGGLPAWGYTVDAFTGKILQKHCAVIPVRANPPGQSGCGPYRLPIPATDLIGACGDAGAPGAPEPIVARPAPVGRRPSSPRPTPGPPVPEYTIEAIRYAAIRGFPLDGLMMGAPKGETIDIAMVVWLVRGGGRTVLFDTGFHREKWRKEFDVTDYLRPDEAVALTGVKPGDVTDVVVSHAHWDHMGGIDLFPAARVWIQKEEYAYYTGDAWQAGGKQGGVDRDDIAALVRLNTEGRVRFVAGDDVEIIPGIRAYTGAKHTYASQYLRIDGPRPVVLASDNCYLDRNLSESVASATFGDQDRAANLAAQKRMIGLAGSADRVIPGHDRSQFERFPVLGRVARIR
jgi:glyoxylase-like metal-dependent hydrolase (beta-lactamase superfamily II)